MTGPCVGLVIHRHSGPGGDVSCLANDVSIFAKSLLSSPTRTGSREGGRGRSVRRAIWRFRHRSERICNAPSLATAFLSIEERMIINWKRIDNCPSRQVEGVELSQKPDSKFPTGCLHSQLVSEVRCGRYVRVVDGIF